ncbi:MAG TPA: LysM peptidoglycan-binding domain-containing M23 family metallopeptidase [Chloroflexota bacterium]|nr:LysM peptidoglycan-binding domain-containing M23 family metallopeptidase [Chloroflexota bacterium]
MRRSPLDGYDATVSVRNLDTSAGWAGFPSLSWSLSDAGDYLSRRAIVHLSVLALAIAVVAGSAFVNQTPEDTAVAPLAATDSLALSAQTSIVVRAIPFTSPSSDSSYSVKSGDTLSSIARQVGVSEEALLAYNDFSSSDALNVGLQLRVPDLSKVPPDQLRLKDTAPRDLPAASDAAAGATDAALNPQKPAPDLTVYQVQKGDSASRIASVEGVTDASILVSNNLQPSSILSVGQTLVIPGLNGRLVATKPGDTVEGLVEKYGSSPAGIVAANKLPPQTKELVPDQLALVPSDPDVAVALTSAAADAQAGSQDKAPAAPRPASSPGFIWPATGMITTYFSSWHNGIDIANSSGTPVHAVQAGKVVYSGWDNSGYGYMIRIDHGNGLQSLYGHASRLIAKVGQNVDQGEVVMLMGSTGRSTGPHVHFSIFQGSGYNGLNPLKYLP